MLALKEEAYPWAAVLSPYGNVYGGLVPAVGGSDPNPAGRDTLLDDGVSGRLTRHFACSQAHPTHALNERLCVDGRLRSARAGRTVTLDETMVVAALGAPSPGCMSLVSTAVKGPCLVLVIE
jgi:hypothetical protein